MESRLTIDDKVEIQKAGELGSILLLLFLLMTLSLWGFAFIPEPMGTSEWVNRLQSVCFGTLTNGMPAPHGWMLLVLGPLMMLSFMWASHAEELRYTPLYIRKNFSAKLILVGLLFLLMWVSHWTGKRITRAYRISNLSFESKIQNPLPWDYPKLHKTIPNFNLMDQKGQIFSNLNLKNQVSLIAFTYGHCSTVCPVLIRDVLMAQKKLGLENVKAVFVTIDPWRDTPSSLESLSKTWSMGENAFMLSGSPNEIQKVLKDFELVTERNEKTGDIVHPAQIMISDKNGFITYNFLNPTVDWLVDASLRLLNE